MVPGCVLITGATGGIGRALAQEYARAGTATLILQGRNADVLQALAGDCRALGARVLTQVLDVRDHQALMQWLGEMGASEAPELVVVNAGVNISTGPGRQGESWDDMLGLYEVNIRAAMATVQASLPAMRARGSGQIALVSSLAAWRGLPETPSYSASKAAVKAYGEAMRDALAGTGVKINVIMPGYVESAMCAAMPGPKPFLWQAPRAARAIRLGLARDRARISFPFPLNLGCFLLSVLPPAASGRILRLLGYGGA